MMMRNLTVKILGAGLAWCGLVVLPHPAVASPHFSRQYEISCAVCHSAGPKLNRAGEAFIHRGLLLPHWDEITTTDTRDPEIKLPKALPLSIRTQAYARVRRGETLDLQTASAVANADYDIQAPYTLDLVGGTALTSNVSMRFNATLADRGITPHPPFERAIFTYTGLLGAAVIGQFPISDILFSRHQRLTVQDYLPYDLAGLGNERGVLFNLDLVYGGLTLGASNGNGTQTSTALNSPGLGRSDRLFDNNNVKDYFARVGLDTDVINGGLFMLIGERPNAAENMQITRTVSGVDGNLAIADRFYLYGQALMVRWEDFQRTSVADTWYGGFIGMDYIANAGSSFSLLYNYVNAGTLATAANIYRGIGTNTITANASHYFARNVRGVIEITTDFLLKDTAQYGHNNKEDYFLVGLDLTF
ncbi:MAG: hypothetical protein OEW08_15415 [Gammaproteobacteria bacterium]|nr:hypothetical protein [Gammaproteobacteria bacterium]